MNQEQEIMRNSEEEGVKDGLLESTLEAVEVMNRGELLHILRVLKADLERRGFEPQTEIEAEIWRGAKETLEKEYLEREKENFLTRFQKMDQK